MKTIIFIAIGLIGICLLVLLSAKISQKSPTPAIVESGTDALLKIPDDEPMIFKDSDDVDYSPDLQGDDYKHLTIIVEGKEIIRFQPDKKIIGMDGRVIGYLNDEEVKLLEKFWE